MVATSGFANVTEAGATTVTSLPPGTGGSPPPPANFTIGEPAIAYEITTSATFTGAISLCFGYAGVAYPNPESLTLLHFENGGWVNITTGDWSARSRGYAKRDETGPAIRDGYRWLVQSAALLMAAALRPHYWTVNSTTRRCSPMRLIIRRYTATLIAIVILAVSLSIMALGLSGAVSTGKPWRTLIIPGYHIVLLNALLATALSVSPLAATLLWLVSFALILLPFLALDWLRARHGQATG